MKECSLAIGVSQDRLISNEAAINNLATNLSHYLTALSSIIPQKFSSTYRSPCWETPIVLSTQQRKELRVFRKTIPLYLTEMLTEHLYQTILEPALHQKNNRSLMCLPAFFLAGFPKSGTTTLHSILYKLDMISRPGFKEPHWLTRMPLKNGDHNYLILTFAWYLQYYYNQANSEIKRKPQLLTYDASQSTLWDSNFHIDYEDYCSIPILLSHILPSAKFIVVMRNPVTRTHSHHIYSCAYEKRQPPSSTVFHEMVVADIKYFQNCLSTDRTIYECTSDKHFKKGQSGGCNRSMGYYLTISMYYLHLKKWMQLFPRESFLFLRMEDMSIDPYTFMRNITDFLNIDHLPPQSTRLLFSYRKNVKNVEVEMLPETQAVLSEFFHPFNEKLVELTGDNRFLWKDTI